MPLRIAKRTPLDGEVLKLVVEETGRVTGSGKTVHLTPQETKLVVHMADRSPRTCTREQLIMVVRPPSHRDEAVDLDLIKVLVSRIREKLKVITDLEVIETVRGVGYRIPNYVEISTNMIEGETIRVPADVFAMLVSLTFDAGEDLDKVIRRVLVAGGKKVQQELANEKKEETDDDPWD